MSGALLHSRHRIPGLVNPDIGAFYKLIWITEWADTDGNFSFYTQKTGENVYIDFGDGTIGRGNDVHNYADDSEKTIKVWSTDTFSGLLRIYANSKKGLGTLPTLTGCTGLTEFGFDGNAHTGSVPSFAESTALTYFNVANNLLSGTLPSFATCVALIQFDLRGNSISSTLPSFDACTPLQKFYISVNDFTGTLPPFNSCTALKEFTIGENTFSGALPSFSACTALELFQAHQNGFTSYTSGCFSTQKNLAQIKLHTNSWNQANVDSCLSDLVDSLGGGRVTCTVELNGAGMAAPSSLTAHNTLEAAGWTVDVN